MTHTGKELYEFGPYRLDPEKRLLMRGPELVPLQMKAFETLLALVRHSEQVVLKDDLMKTVWPDTFVEESNLTQNIFVLRKILGEAGNRRYIITVPGRGYSFGEKVRIVSPEDSLVIQSRSLTRVTIQEPRRAALRWQIFAPVIASVLLAAGLYWQWHRTPRFTGKDTLVLADFANSTGDPVFDDALRQGLSSQLEQSPFLNLLPDQRVAQTLALMTQPKDAHLTQELALEVCRRTASTAVLDGSIAQVGKEFLLTLKAVNCSTGESLASAGVQASDKDHVLDALGKAASEIRRKLGESLASVQKYDAPPEDVTTSSLEALQAYSLGYRTMIAKNDRPGAIPLFQRAISLDPKFAMAYARLGIGYFNLDEPTRAEENLQKAYELRERLSEREKLYVAASYEAMAKGNMVEARKSYEMWQQIYPRDQFAVGNLGVVYGYLGQYDKGLKAIQDAWQLNPGNALVFSNIVGGYLQQGRLAEAKTFASKAKDLRLDSPALHSNLYLVEFLEHDQPGMDREASELMGKPGWEDSMLFSESYTAAFAGHFAQARILTRRAIDSATRADKKESAATYEAASALSEALVGNFDLARQQAKQALALSRGKEVDAFAAMTNALSGDAAQAKHLAEGLNQRFPEDTSVQFNFLPIIRAASALQAGHSGDAIQALSAAQPYELGETTEEVTFYLYPAYFRGQAYLEAKQPTAAAGEFQKILDHPGLVANEPIGALAHLGVGRAYRLIGDQAKARSAYQDFLNLWKDADPDLPILKQAKQEFAKLP